MAAVASESKRAPSLSSSSSSSSPIFGFSAKDHPGIWACSRCTNENDNKIDQCTACEAWQCKRCTYHNDDTAMECSQCELWRGTTEFRGVPSQPIPLQSARTSSSSSSSSSSPPRTNGFGHSSMAPPAASSSSKRARSLSPVAAPPPSPPSSPTCVAVADEETQSAKRARMDLEHVGPRVIVVVWKNDAESVSVVGITWQPFLAKCRKVFELPQTCMVQLSSSDVWDESMLKEYQQSPQSIARVELVVLPGDDKDAIMYQAPLNDIRVLDVITNTLDFDQPTPPTVKRDPLLYLILFDWPTWIDLNLRSHKRSRVVGSDGHDSSGVLSPVGNDARGMIDVNHKGGLRTNEVSIPVSVKCTSRPSVDIMQSNTRVAIFDTSQLRISLKPQHVYSRPFAMQFGEIMHEACMQFTIPSADLYLQPYLLPFARSEQVLVTATKLDDYRAYLLPRLVKADCIVISVFVQHKTAIDKWMHTHFWKSMLSSPLPIELSSLAPSVMPSSPAAVITHPITIPQAAAVRVASAVAASSSLSSSSASPSLSSLLPAAGRRRLMLLLDLDKTLLLCRTDHTENLKLGGRLNTGWQTDFMAHGKEIMLRTGVGQFMREAVSYYDIWIVTAGSPKYACECINQANKLNWRSTSEPRRHGDDRFEIPLGRVVSTLYASENNLSEFEKQFVETTGDNRLRPSLHGIHKRGIDGQALRWKSIRMALTYGHQDECPSNVTILDDSWLAWPKETQDLVVIVSAMRGESPSTTNGPTELGRAMMTLQDRASFFWTQVDRITAVVWKCQVAIAVVPTQGIQDAIACALSMETQIEGMGRFMKRRLEEHTKALLMCIRELEHRCTVFGLAVTDPLELFEHQLQLINTYPTVTALYHFVYARLRCTIYAMKDAHTIAAATTRGPGSSSSSSLSSSLSSHHAAARSPIARHAHRSSSPVTSPTRR